ncbi:MAG: helix-turn-helix domain-containing protein [Spirochaetota bacterium]|jgi:transcriptional regulator with XRE-family HTH domain|nr:helix-turn-helix domain-containing protein [Spirochaetota bacterium]
MTNIREVLAFNIKTLRSDLGLSQAKLADFVNTSTRYIQQIEGCKSFPSPEMLERIASALKKDTMDLFGIPSPHREWKEKILAEIGDVLTKHTLEIEKPQKKIKMKNTRLLQAKK